jgi:hypothetical protein
MVAAGSVRRSSVEIFFWKKCFLCLYSNNNFYNSNHVGESETQNRKGHDARHREETHLQALRVAMGRTHGQAKVLSGVQIK